MVVLRPARARLQPGWVAVDALPWGDIGKITGLSGTGMLALVVVGFLKGWIWPAFAVNDIRKQRDEAMKQNELLSRALSRCLKREAQ